MKNYLKTRITYDKFILSLFILFLLVIGFKAGMFFWDNRQLSQHKITIMAQNTYVSQGVGNLFIELREIKDNELVQNGKVKIHLENHDEKKLAELGGGEIFDGVLNLNFQLPELAAGKYSLVADVSSKFGRDKVKKQLEIKKEIKVMVSTDRPLYKPGQIMDFRVLALDKLTLQPLEKQEITVTISDPGGNKIFRKNYQSSPYGIISGNFIFADELAFGDYKIEAEAAQTTNEKIVEIKNFQLPKFEVSLETDQDMAKPQNEISGIVKANYFHGQSVTKAKTIVNLQTNVEKQSYQGETDEQGIMKFRFSGLNTVQTGSIKIVAEVTDGSNNKISSEKSSVITGDNILVELFPEAGKLKPGLDNEILIVTSRADGTPVKTTVFMTGEKIREFSTNESGLAKFTYRPQTGLNQSRFSLDVRDGQGRVLKKTFTLENEINQTGHLLLRTDKTVYRDNNLNVEVLATQDKLAYLEILQDGLVIHSEIIDVKEGRADKNIMIPEKAFGTVEIRAMQIFTSTQPNQPASRHNRLNNAPRQSVTGDSKIIFVDRTKNLDIAIESDKNTYLPGEEAHFDFQITSENNTAENSALGIKIVDEALLALGNEQSELSEFMFIADDKVRDYAISLNGLGWQDILNNPDNELNNIILQAMLKNVPREKAVFATLEKDNTAAWRNYENDKRKLFSYLFIFMVAILIGYCIHFWWKITANAKNRTDNLKIWGSALIVSGLALIAATSFVEDNFRHASFFYRLSEVLEFLSSAIYHMTDSPFVAYILSAIFFGAAYLAWDRRQTFFSQHQAALKSFFTVFAIFIVLVISEIYGSNVTQTMGEGFWFFIANLALATVVVGILYFMVVRNFEKTGITVWTGSLIFLTGLTMPILGAAFLFLFPLFLLFALIRGGRGKPDEEYIENKILALEKKLKDEGKEKEAIELEIMLLKRDLGSSRLYAKIGLAITWFFMLAAAALALFFIFNFISNIQNVNFLPSRTMPSPDLSSPLSLAAADPRENAVSLIRVAITLLGLFSCGLIIMGGIRRAFKYGRKNRARLMIMLGVIGLVLVMSFFLIINFVVTNVSSSLSDSGPGDTGFRRPPPVDIEGGSIGFGAGPDMGIEFAGGLELADSGPSIGSVLGPLSLGSKDRSDQALLPPALKEGEIALFGQSEEQYQKAKRVRKFFPETMYWDAELIAQNGRAELSIPMKDSITSWRLSVLANSLSGKIGSSDKNIIVFQDFFIDFDPPYNLTAGDDFWLPITLSNYLPEEQRIKLELSESDYYTWLEGGRNFIALRPGEVRNVFVRLRLDRMGDFVLRVEAQGTKMADAAEKIFSVSPYGRFIAQTVASEQINEDNINISAIFPDTVMRGTEKILVKIYPSVYSEIVEGLEAMLRMPNGCFEQISSSLYPNILILKYLDKSGQESPDIRARAENFISQGLQKLLTYELEPGGFSYYGRPPAETILTAYGLMQFSEMRGVVFVDENLIARTRDYLFKQQNSNGTFKIAGSHRGGFSGGDELAMNAYIIWAVSQADPNDPRLANSIRYLQNNIDNLKQSPYALVLAANALVNHDPKANQTLTALSHLKQLIERDGENLAYLKMVRPNYFGSYGQYGNIEITALAAVALVKSGDLESSDSLLKYIIKNKSGSGSWGSTQSTAMALKALAENEIAKKTVRNNLGALKISLNNRESATFDINTENSEVVQYLKLDNNIMSDNQLSITRQGNISASLQVTKEYYEDWSHLRTQTASDLVVNQEFGLDNNLNVAPVQSPDLKMGHRNFLYISLRSRKDQRNAVADISIPAGFEIVSQSLDCQLTGNTRSRSDECADYILTARAPKLSRYEIKTGRIILYFDHLPGNHVVLLPIAFTPRTVGKFKVMPARLYAYYDPYNEAYSRPIETIEVKY